MEEFDMKQWIIDAFSIKPIESTIEPGTYMMFGINSNRPVIGSVFGDSIDPSIVSFPMGYVEGTNPSDPRGEPIQQAGVLIYGVGLMTRVAMTLSLQYFLDGDDANDRKLVAMYEKAIQDYRSAASGIVIADATDLPKGPRIVR